MTQEIATFHYQPKISIAMPVYNVEEKWLRLCIDSILNQVYTNWELCMADDASTDPNVKKILTEYGNWMSEFGSSFVNKMVIFPKQPTLL